MSAANGEDDDTRWLGERVADGARFSLRADRVIARRTGAAQDLALIETAAFGKVLLLDGAVQTSTGDEFIYHEMMAHVPLLAHGAPRDVLIVGGGDGGLAEEVLKHRSVARLVQVEIDAAVVEFARTHLGEINAAAFADPRLHIIIGDGAGFAAETEDRFDIVMVDSTDPTGPGAVLFTDTFYRDVRRCLKPGGVLVTQSGLPFVQSQSFSAAMHALSRTFADAACYLIHVPSYVGGPMALGWASDDAGPRDVSTETLSERLNAAGLALSYYTPQVHRAAFALPLYVAAMLHPRVKPAGDD